MSERKVPKLRFAGFTDDWKQRQVKYLCEISTGKSNTQDKVENGTYPFYVRSATIETSHRYLFDEEAVLTVGDGVGTGKVFHYVNGKYDLHQRVYRIFNFSSEISGKYFYYYFSVNFYHRVMMMTAKTSVDSVRLDMIADMEISYPIIEEQLKIVQFFEELDDTIAFHQREWEKYKNLKISYLEKMFPQENENKPQLRFPNFTDAWKQRKLGELMDVTSVKRVHQSDWTSSGVRFLRARDIVAFAKNEIVEDPLYISIQQYNEYSKLSGAVNIGDVLVTGVGTIGVPMLIDDEKPVYFKDGNIIWFKNNNKIDGRFLYYAFTAPYIQCFISNVAGIGTVGTYTIENGKKTPIFLPTLAEQQAIGEFFKQLDDTIAFHQRELEKYKNLKEGYLKQMFV